MKTLINWKQLLGKHGFVRMTSRGLLTMVIFLLMAACQPASPTSPPVSNPNVLCFIQSVGVPYANNQPIVDGVVSGDYGWTDTFRYMFQNSSTVPDAIVQGIKDGSNLYLSFEVNNDTTFDDNDAIVLTFSPGGGAANDRRIHIFPVFTGVGAAGGGAPREVDYWTNSSTWNTGSAVKIVDPAWLTGNIRVTSASSGATQNHWYVEIMIPITGAPSTDPATDTGINFPLTGNFGMYIDVIRVASSGGSETAAERVWPPGAPTIFPFLEVNTPAPSAWGHGSLGGSICNGVSVYFSSISTNNTDPHEISLNAANIFSAQVYNTSTDGSGIFIPAPGINATFKIANFGIPGPGSWSLVPAAGNPTANTTILAATGASAGTATLSTGAWTLTPAQVTDYTGHEHQCILVELGGQAGTTFVNKSAWTNMDFVVTSSPFKASAKLGTKGYKLPEGRNIFEFIITEFNYNVDPGLKWDENLNDQDLSGKPQFLLDVKPESEVDLITVTTPPDVKIPSQFVKLPAGTDPSQRPVEIEVQPGGLVTVIAQGSLGLRQSQEAPFNLPAGPNGIDLGEKFKGEKFLLSEQQDPFTRAGALVGSWDGFKSGFVIGQGMTLRVPDKAKLLYLAINDTADGYKQQFGDGYQIQVVVTPLEKFYTFTDSIVSRDPSYETLQVPLGANLPTTIFCAQRRTGQTLTINGTKYDLVEDVGCYGYIFTRIGKP